MNTKYIAPLKIEINNFKKPIKIDKFLIRKISQQEQESYLEAKKITFDKNGRLSSLIPPVNKCQNPSFLPLFSFSERFKIQSCQFIVESAIIFCADPPTFNFVYPRFIKSINKYSIDSKELPQIRKIYSLIQKNKNDLLLRVFERFQNAISDTSDKKNAFIDFVTILESLFLSNEKTEMRFRFSLYISFVILNNINESVNFGEIQDIYDARSQLVHSGKSKLYNDTMYLKTEEYTRKLLLWYLKNNGLCKIDIKHNLLSFLKINT